MLSSIYRQFSDVVLQLRLLLNLWRFRAKDYLINSINYGKMVGAISR